MARIRILRTVAFTERENDGICDVEENLRKLHEGLSRTAEMMEKLPAAPGSAERELAETRLMMLRDPLFLEEMERTIRSGLCAENAVVRTARSFAEQLRAIPDPYLSERSADIEDVGRRLLYSLTGENTEEPPSGDIPVIVVAKELLPSQVSGFDPSHVAGIAAERCGVAGHAAILAGMKGIPMITDVIGLTELAREGEEAILDGSAGDLVFDPEPRTAAAYAARRRSFLDADNEPTDSGPVVTKDGQAVHAYGNIGRPEETAETLAKGGRGIGLFRTEFLFLDRDVPPSEEEHMNAYSSVLAAMSPNPVIIRTLDAGGDKEIPFLKGRREDNPFLGLRAIRLCLARPGVFRTQLRALLRSAPSGKLWIMLPMVTDVSELVAAKALLSECAAELESEGKDFALPEKTGVMIEVPSAALMADVLAEEADFFSIGTNDLTQYTLASDRGNADVAQLYSPFHPAVLRLLASVAKAAAHRGIPAGICGEMAGDPLATPLLLGLGFRELSMSPARIPLIRRTIRTMDAAKCALLAERVLAMGNRTDVIAELKRAAG
jgi:phosphotransferase system enzyme I (PtsI)